MRNTDFSIIDPAALGAVTGGCKQKQQPPPQQQAPAQMAAPQPQCDSGVEVTVATGAQAAALMGGGAAGQAQPGAVQAPKLI